LASCPVWFYCPADDPAALEVALTTRATAVIFDLEDTVLPSRKELARDELAERAERVRQVPADSRPAIHVRVNGVGTKYNHADLLAVAALPTVSAVRVAKVSSAAHVREVAGVLDSAGAQRALYPLIEDAVGVLAMQEIANAHKAVRGL